MGLYGFRCRRCGFQFEVSRPLERASEPASCPVDGGESERVSEPRSAGAPPGIPPTVPDRRGSPTHHGHRHPPGTRPHRHDRRPD